MVKCIDKQGTNSWHHSIIDISHQTGLMIFFPPWNKQWDVITPPCHNLDGGLIKTPLKLGYGCVIASHDGLIKWKHFPRYWPFVRGIHLSPVNSPQKPVTRSFDVFFDLRLNKRWSKQWWGWWFETLSRPLWRRPNAKGNTESLHLIMPTIHRWIPLINGN